MATTTVLNEFDELLLKNQENPQLDEALEREARKGSFAPRKYVRILGQGDSDKFPNIPSANASDPNGGVVVRFAAVRHPEDPPGKVWKSGLGTWVISARVHFIPVMDAEGKIRNRRIVCCGDYAASEKTPGKLDEHNCPSCAWTLTNAQTEGLDLRDFKTPGLPRDNAYYLIFNESAREEDYKLWVEEGVEFNIPRTPEEFIQPLWLLEVSSRPLKEQISSQNRDTSWGRLPHYRVRLWKDKGGRGTWDYHLKGCVDDILNERKYLPWRPEQIRAMAQYNEGTEVNGELVVVPDLRYTCYPMDPEDQKIILSGGTLSARQQQRDEEATARFADNARPAGETRVHAPLPDHEEDEPVFSTSSPVTSPSTLPPAAKGKVTW